MTLLDLALPYQKEVILDPSMVRVLNWSRQVGKSWCCAYIASFMCCKKPSSLVLYLSTGQRAASEALKTCVKFAEAIKVLSNGKIDHTENASCVTFSNGSRIMSLPGTPASCRGWTADLIILDECAFWQNPEDTWQAIVPTITNQIRGSDKKVLICSTPRGRNNLFYELCQKAKEERNWKYFQTTIWDAQKDGLKVNIEDLKQMIPDPYAWANEYECKFCDSVNQLVPIDSMIFQSPSKDEKFQDYFIGADFARSSDGTSFAVFGRRPDNTLVLVELMNIHNTPYAQQVAVGRQLFQKWRPRLFYGDATGLGGPLMEQLNRECSVLIKPFVFNHVNKNAAYEYFRKCVFDRKVVFDSQWKDDIIEDVLLVQQTISEDGKVVYSAHRHNNSHADNISAIILALQAERECRVQSTQPQAVAAPTLFNLSQFNIFS